MGGLLILTWDARHCPQTLLLGAGWRCDGIIFPWQSFYGASIILIAQIITWVNIILTAVLVGGRFFALWRAILSPWLTLFSLLLALLWFAMEWSWAFSGFVPLFLVAATYVLFKGRQSVMLFLVSAFAMLLWLEYFLFPGRGFDLHAEHFAFAAVFLFSPTPSVLGCIKPTARRPKIIVCYWRCGLCVLPLLQCWRLVLKHRGKN